jgi:hypothetical protein
MFTLKTKIILIATISIIIASIAGIQSIDVSSSEAYAVDATVPSWIKELAGFWIAGEASNSEYLGSIEWLANNGVIRVDTVSAKPTPELKETISDLDKSISKMESKLKRLGNMVTDSEYVETKIMADKPCDTSGFCPGSVPPFVSRFNIEEDLTDVDSIIVNVHSTSTAYPACQLAGYGDGDGTVSTDWFGIQCGENPGAGSVLVYTMIKNPSGDGAMLRAIDLAGPIVPAPSFGPLE